MTRRPRSRRIISAAASLLSAGLGAGVPAHAAEPSATVVYARTSVPNEAQKIGEVSLLGRGGATIVQTVIATRVPSRVLAEIRAKEMSNWPEGSEGRADAEAYLAALEQAGAVLRSERSRLDPRDPAAERRSGLWIEFYADEGAAGVMVATFAPTDGAPYQPTAVREIARPVVARGYVLRNLRLILADAFSRPEADVDALGPLGPAAKRP